MGWKLHVTGHCIYYCRAQTVVLIDKDNHVTYVERTLVAEGGRLHHTTTNSLEFDLCTKS